MEKPNLRFKEFESSYRTCLLNNCLEVTNKRNAKLEYSKEDALSVSDDEGVVNQIKHLGRSYTGADVSNYKILDHNQVVYTKSPLKLKPFGIVKTNSGGCGIVSVLYAIYNVLDGIDPNYINYYFEPFYRLNNYLRPLISKGAKNTINISDETALLGAISIPPSFDEQKKISTFFQSIDRYMDDTQKKISSLKQIKSACLQSMFPVDGELVPKVRFNEFEDEWSPVTVSEVLIERREMSKKTEQFPLMAFVAYKGVCPKGERYDRSALVNDEENKLYKKTYFGDFIYSSNNLETGSIGLNSYGNATISPVYSIFHCSSKAIYSYIGYYMLRKQFIKEMVKWRQGVMYGQWRIHEQDFLQIKMLLPSLNEQKKIGEYFVALDNQISLQTQLFEKLKQIKLACLDNMFV